MWCVIEYSLTAGGVLHDVLRLMTEISGYDSEDSSTPDLTDFKDP